jgi:hypothetical protein
LDLGLFAIFAETGSSCPDPAGVPCSLPRRVLRQPEQPRVHLMASLFIAAVVGDPERWIGSRIGPLFSSGIQYSSEKAPRACARFEKYGGRAIILAPSFL